MSPRWARRLTNMPDPFVLASAVEHEIVEKKSRFITRLHPVVSTDEADELIRSARSEHPDARHHCTALVLSPTQDTGPVHRSNDDGEPSGTAGMPMLQAMLHANLTDALAIVIRYFGGVKLGAGGLTRTYGRAVTEAIAHAATAGALRRRVTLERSRVRIAFDQLGPVENQLRLWADAGDLRHVLETSYSGSHAEMRIAHPSTDGEELAAQVATASSGRAELEPDGSVTVEIDAESPRGT